MREWGAGATGEQERSWLAVEDKCSRAGLTRLMQGRWGGKPTSETSIRNNKILQTDTGESFKHVRYLRNIRLLSSYRSPFNPSMNIDREQINKHDVRSQRRIKQSVHLNIQTICPSPTESKLIITKGKKAPVEPRRLRNTDQTVTRPWHIARFSKNPIRTRILVHM